MMDKIQKIMTNKKSKCFYCTQEWFDNSQKGENNPLQHYEAQSHQRSDAFNDLWTFKCSVVRMKSEEKIKIRVFIHNEIVINHVFNACLNTRINYDERRILPSERSSNS